MIRVDVAYDGSAYSGYVRQPGIRTVQGELEEALSKVLGGPFETRVAGRTDAGVHALGQVVSIHTPAETSADRLDRSLSKLLGDEIAVLDVREVSSGFDARRSAVSRTYRYRALSSDRPDPTRRRNVWWTGRLDMEALSDTAALMVGTHDFRALCKKPRDGEYTVREILSAAWREPSGSAVRDEVWFEVAANAFCHQLVRRIVGRSVAAAKGRLKPVVPEEVTDLGCKPAPPQGLYLVRVDYE